MLVWSLVACLPSELPRGEPEEGPTLLPEEGPTHPPEEGPTLLPEEGPTHPPEEGPALPPSVTVELSGKIDSAGILLEDVKVISGDGVAVLYLAKGTRALDASGKALDSITVTAGPPQVPSYERYLYGLAYDFNPRGARFDPPARLTISYDPSLIVWGVNEYSPQFGYFEEVESTWIWLDVTADFNIHCVTAGIDHLGTFVLSFEIWPAPPPMS